MRIAFPQEKTPSFSIKKLIASKTMQLTFSAILLFCLGFSFYVQKSQKYASDVWKTDALLSSMQKGQKVDFAELFELRNRSEQTRPLLDAFLAREFLARGDTQSGLFLGKDTLERLVFIDPVYQSFIETTLLIEKKDFALAYEKTLNLHQVIQEMPESSLLFFNTLRLMFLEKILGKSNLAKKRLDDMKNQAGWQTFVSQVCQDEDLLLQFLADSL